MVSRTHQVLFLVTAAIFSNFRCALRHIQALQLSSLRVVVWLIHIPKHSQLPHFFLKKLWFLHKKLKGVLWEFVRPFRTKLWRLFLLIIYIYMYIYVYNWVVFFDFYTEYACGCTDCHWRKCNQTLRRK